MGHNGMYLSKSRYLRGLQCHKSLWLLAHHPELVSPSEESTKPVLKNGYEVGDLACTRYPGGKMIPTDISLGEQIALTKEALGSADIIYEAAFSDDNVFIRADILKKKNAGWELYEVKSAASVKDEYYSDLAVQYYVLDNAGISINKASLVHINSSYVRSGPLDLQQLFKVVDLTEDARIRQTEVIENLARMRSILKGDEPAIDIGPHCNAPWECDFVNYCWRHIPKDSVFDLAGRGVDKFALYRQGLVKLEDIPLDRLNSRQRQQVEAACMKCTVTDPVLIGKFLDQLWYPLCFLDFETFMSPVPLYDGIRPYQQVPFQYSLHYKKSSESELTHREFLADPGIDPRPQFIQSLLKAMPADACILVYNKAFETTRLKELAEHFPELRKDITSLIDHILDLMVPFKDRALYDWRQKGSYSIKKVLPAFVDGLSYDGMSIADGGAAMDAYHRMCAIQDDESALKQLRKDLLDYCQLDTLAMVRLLDVLCEHIGKPVHMAMNATIRSSSTEPRW